MPAAPAMAAATPLPIDPEPVQPFIEGRHFIVMKDLTYQIGDSDTSIVVPRGFVTDFASIPSIFWTVAPPTGRYQWAAVVHDYLYWSQGCTKDVADRTLRLAMFEHHVPALERETIYRAVDLLGKSAWNDDRHERDQGIPHFVPLDSGGEPVIAIGANETWAQYQTRLPRAPFTSPPTLPAYCDVIVSEAAKRGL